MIAFAHFNAEYEMHPLKATDISASEGSLIKAIIFTSDITVFKEEPQQHSEKGTE
jgi:hypothetical protein